MNIRPLLLLSGTLLFPGIIQAKLDFPQTSITVKATNEATSLVSKFSFTNTGEEPVYILSVTSSCECTVPSVDKKHYAPGESGEVRVTYNIGINEGPQSQTISVITSEKTENSYALTFKADLPRGLRGGIPSANPVAPSSLFWTRKPFATKTVTVDLKSAQGSKFTVTCDPSDAFQIETEAPAEKREAKVKITPIARGGEVRGELTVNLEAANGENSKYKVRLHILSDKPAAPP